MSLTNYSDLQTAVANHLHRTDLTSIIPDLITMAEHRIYGDLDSRKQDTVTSLSTVASQEYVDIPADFINTRTLVNQSSAEVLDYKSPDQFAKEFITGATGSPLAYTIVGDKFYLAPIPDGVYTLRLVYQQKVPSISTGTNWLMTAYPSVYLYATLVEASPYIKDDQRIQIWADFYNDAIKAVNSQDWSSMATMLVKGDVQF